MNNLQRLVVWLNTGDNSMWLTLPPCSMLLALCAIGLVGA